jgi:hypothetical protein
LSDGLFNPAITWRNSQNEFFTIPFAGRPAQPLINKSIGLILLPKTKTTEKSRKAVSTAGYFLDGCKGMIMHGYYIFSTKKIVLHGVTGNFGIVFQVHFFQNMSAIGADSLYTEK